MSSVELKQEAEKFKPKAVFDDGYSWDVSKFCNLFIATNHYIVKA